MVNEVAIKRRLADLRKKRRGFAKSELLDVRDFSSSPEKIWSLEHGRQISIQENDISDYTIIQMTSYASARLAYCQNNSARRSSRWRVFETSWFTNIPKFDLREVYRVLQENLSDYIEAYLVVDKS